MSTYSYVSLTGGLGNQLFQYFFALAIGQLFKFPIKIDDSRQQKIVEHSNSKLTDSGLMLENSEIVYRIGQFERFRRLIDYGLHHVLVLGSFSNNLDYTRTMLATCYESNKTDPKRLLDSAVFPRAKRYVGYFQSYEYFDSIDQDGRDHFQLRAAEKAKSSGIFDEELPVAIHVRRGDYRLRDDFVQLDSDYYLRAIDELGVTGERGLVLSDEPNSKDVREIARLTGLDVAPEISPVETVGVLASAKSLVIANSSLSFASGLIGNSGQTGVAAPMDWRSPNVTRRPIMNYPTNWTKVRH